MHPLVHTSLSVRVAAGSPASPVLCQVLSPPPLPLQGWLVDRQHCVVVGHVAVAVDVPIVVAVLLAQQRSLWQMFIASIRWRRSSSNIISYSPKEQSFSRWVFDEKDSTLAGWSTEEAESFHCDILAQEFEPGIKEFS